MPAGQFADSAGAVVDWFAALNPYEFGGSILKIEDVNASLDTGKPEPLYCWAISSKRYALFNLAPDGGPIMRKVSAHGLGHLRSPYGESDAPGHLPTPHQSVLGSGIERWHCDLWNHIVSAGVAGHPDQVRLDYHPALNATAISRYAATTPELLRWFSTYNRDRQYRDQVKPFGFLLSMMQGFSFGVERIAGDAKSPRKKPGHLKPVAAFDSDHAKAIASAFDRDTGEAVPASSLKSYADALAQYHMQPESKFLNADYFDRGMTIRRHVEMTSTQHIGKESHDWERQAVLGISSDAQLDYGISLGDRLKIVERLEKFVGQVGKVKSSKALGTTPARLHAILDGEKSSAITGLLQSVSARLPAAIQLYAKLDQDRLSELESLRKQVGRVGLRATARRLRIDPSNLRRTLAPRAN